VQIARQAGPYTPGSEVHRVSVPTDNVRSPGDAPTVEAPAGDADEPVATGPGRWWTAVSYSVTRFLAVAAALQVTVWASVHFLDRNPSYPGRPLAFSGDFLVDGWMRWDGGWYVAISHAGYTYRPGEMSSVAYFPAYPLTMRVLQPLVRDDVYVLPGIVLTILCGLGAAVLLYRWFGRVTRMAPSAAAWPSGRRRAIARTATLLLLVYPYAWYLYGAVYADALFLLCAVAAFVLIEHDRPVLAGIVALVATAARPVGIGLVIGLVAVLAERRELVAVPFLDDVRTAGWRPAWATGREGGRSRFGALAAAITSVRLHPGRLRGRDAGILLSLGGLLAWMWFLRNAFGDPMLFAKVQGAPGWDQEPGPHTWFKVPWFEKLAHLATYVHHPHAHWDDLIYTLGITVQAILVIGALLLVPLVVRRVGWGYAVYVVGVVGVPLLGSKDWQGTGRYLLAAFPVFLVVGWWLTERATGRLRIAVVATSFVTLVVLASSFARGFYLA
jgi:hypothetical protein